MPDHLQQTLAVDSWILVSCAILSAGFALFFLLIIRYSFFKGLAWALLLGALTETVYAVWRLTGANASLPQDAMVQLERVSSYTYITWSLLFAGIALWLIGGRSQLFFWKGLGLGLIIQGTLATSLLLTDRHELKRNVAPFTPQGYDQTKYPKKIEPPGNS